MLASPSPNLVDAVCSRFNITSPEDVEWCRMALSHALDLFEQRRQIIRKEFLLPNKDERKKVRDTIGSLQNTRKHLDSLWDAARDYLFESTDIDRQAISDLEDNCAEMEKQLSDYINMVTSRDGRPRHTDTINAVTILGHIYNRHTGKKPGRPGRYSSRSGSDERDKYTGKFYEFCKIVAQELGDPALIEELPRATRHVSKNWPKLSQPIPVLS